MNQEGPELAILTRRLSEAPPEVLGEVPALIVAAVLSDALRDLGGSGLTAREAAAMTPATASEAASNKRRWLLIGAWLLRSEALRPVSAESGAAERARDWLARDTTALAEVLDARQVLADVDRREEIVRRALAALGLRPLGESRAQAEDRLRSLDSIERQRVILETRAAQERARKIREEMARKAAEEAAAARYGRE
jgi:hypothetical protein